MKIEHGISLYVIFLIGLVLVADFFQKDIINDTIKMLKTNQIYKKENFVEMSKYIPEEAIFTQAEQELDNVGDFLLRTADSYNTMENVYEKMVEEDPQSFNSHTLFQKFSPMAGKVKDKAPFDFYDKQIDDKRRVFDLDINYQMKTPVSPSPKPQEVYGIVPFDPYTKPFSTV